MPGGRTIRGRLVREKDILIDVHKDGCVHVDLENLAIKFTMTEDQAITFRDLLTAVLTWEVDDANG